jgi:hypothetical protein
MSFALKTETHTGKIMALRRGFSTYEEAESHPVTLSLWKRVWVEQEADQEKPDEELPPFPWEWIAAGSPSNNGSFHAYLVASNGKKIAAIWGNNHNKRLIANFVTDACNDKHLKDTKQKQNPETAETKISETQHETPSTQIEV